MTYHQKNTTVFLMNSILIFGYYLSNVYRMVQEDSFIPINVYALWATLIVLAIIVAIISTIVTQIVFAIIHRVQTGEEPNFIEDERDKLIELKGTRVAYGVFSVGVGIAMLTLILNKPTLVMFNILIIASFSSDIVSHLSRLYYYRRGI